MWLADKNDGQDDPRTHLVKWTKVYGEAPQPEWVHLFSHTLDVISMNWYLEIEIRHGTGEWDILHERFIMRSIFEDGFDYIDEAVQEVKATIFRIRKILWI